MPKRYTSFRKRTYRRKRKTYRRKGKGRNMMQKMASAGIRMKYTTVFTPKFNLNDTICQGTVCLAGGRGPQATPIVGSDRGYTTLFDVNPDGKTRSDMKLYQQFCIYGVSIKYFFAEPTTPEQSPVQLALAYSPNQCLNPILASDRMQSMSSYQTMPCNQNRSVNRYYKLGYTKKKLGIDFCPTDSFSDFANNTTNLYGGQLPAGTGPSIGYKIFRNTAGAEGPACRMQVTYYIRYRGTRGNNSLVV